MATISITRISLLFCITCAICGNAEKSFYFRNASLVCPADAQNEALTNLQKRSKVKEPETVLMAQSSSMLGYNTAKRAFDGKFDKEHSLKTMKTHNSWWMMFFKQEVSITGLKILCGDAGTRPSQTYRIEYGNSLDTLMFKSFDSQNTTEYNTPEAMCFIQAQFRAKNIRYVRILLLSQSSLTISEVYISGIRVSSTPKTLGLAQEHKYWQQQLGLLVTLEMRVFWSHLLPDIDTTRPVLSYILEFSMETKNCSKTSSSSNCPKTHKCHIERAIFVCSNCGYNSFSSQWSEAASMMTYDMCSDDEQLFFTKTFRKFGAKRMHYLLKNRKHCSEKIKVCLSVITVFGVETQVCRAVTFSCDNLIPANMVNSVYENAKAAKYMNLGAPPLISEGAMRLLDGNFTTTAYTTQRFPQKQNPWWMIQLETAHRINSFTVHFVKPNVYHTIYRCPTDKRQWVGEYANGFILGIMNILKGTILKTTCYSITVNVQSFAQYLRITAVQNYISEIAEITIDGHVLDKDKNVFNRKPLSDRINFQVHYWSQAVWNFLRTEVDDVVAYNLFYISESSNCVLKQVEIVETNFPNVNWTSPEYILASSRARRGLICPGRDTSSTYQTRKTFSQLGNRETLEFTLTEEEFNCISTDKVKICLQVYTMFGLEEEICHVRSTSCRVPVLKHALIAQSSHLQGFEKAFAAIDGDLKTVTSTGYHLYNTNYYLIYFGRSVTFGEFAIQPVIDNNKVCLLSLVDVLVGNDTEHLKSVWDPKSNVVTRCVVTIKVGLATQYLKIAGTISQMTIKEIYFFNVTKLEPYKDTRLDGLVYFNVMNNGSVAWNILHLSRPVLNYRLIVTLLITEENSKCILEDFQLRHESDSQLETAESREAFKGKLISTSKCGDFEKAIRHRSLQINPRFIYTLESKLIRSNHCGDKLSFCLYIVTAFGIEETVCRDQVLNCEKKIVPDNTEEEKGGATSPEEKGISVTPSKGTEAAENAITEKTEELRKELSTEPKFENSESTTRAFNRETFHRTAYEENLKGLYISLTIMACVVIIFVIGLVIYKRKEIMSRLRGDEAN